MEDINYKFANLINILWSKTEENKLLWERTENENEFQVSFSKYNIRISARESQYDDSIYYEVSIFDSLGTRIETINGSDLADFREPHQKLRDLHTLARRQALGVREAIDDLLRDLE